MKKIRKVITYKNTSSCRQFYNMVMRNKSHRKMNYYDNTHKFYFIIILYSGWLHNYNTYLFFIGKKIDFYEYLIIPYI